MNEIMFSYIGCDDWDGIWIANRFTFVCLLLFPFLKTKHDIQYQITKPSPEQILDYEQQLLYQHKLLYQNKEFSMFYIYICYTYTPLYISIFFTLQNKLISWFGHWSILCEMLIYVMFSHILAIIFVWASPTV